MTDWSYALEALNEFNNNSYNLPSDNSLISPVARVILEKRRLLQIQKMHNLLLKVSHEPSETLLQGEREREFLLNFKITVSKLNWNELSVCEAHAFSSLLVDTLLRCQADNHLINSYIIFGAAEIQGPDFQNRFVALRTSMIVVYCFMVIFPKNVSPWANDLLKSAVYIFKGSPKNLNNHDLIHEALKFIQVLLRLPDKFIESKEREKILPVISKFLKAQSFFIAVEAAKAYDVYFNIIGSMNKAHVNNILEVLNNGLSTKLYESKCSVNLLEYCFELKSTENPELDLIVLRNNIERIRKYYNINEHFFADSFANVLLRWKKSEEILEIIKLLLTQNFKSSVSPMCFSRIIELYVLRCENQSESMNMIRIIYQLLWSITDDYALELLRLLVRVYNYFPASLNESEFSLTVPFISFDLQSAYVDLVEVLFQDRPMILVSKITILFAQLKGNLLYLKLGDVNVNKCSLFGEILLFDRFVKLLIDNYTSYCDWYLIEKIQSWLSDMFDEENEWLKNETNIITGLFLLTAAFKPKILEYSMFTLLERNILSDDILVKFLCKDQDFFKLFLGSIEKYILNDFDNKLEPTSSLMVFLTKLICHFNFTENDAKFTKLIDAFSRLFWKSTERTKDYCLVMFISCLSCNSALIPLQILKCTRAILEFSKITKGDANVIGHVQEIIKRFVNDEDYEVRIICGISMGMIVRLFDESDEVGIQELFEQFMKYSMKSEKPSNTRVVYILGLAVLKSQLDSENMKVIDLNSSTLFGLLASWNRETNFDNFSNESEIVASTVTALSFYLDKCGCMVTNGFFLDSCELLLEQVFLRSKCKLIIDAVMNLCRCLSFYVNLIPSQSEYIAKCIRLLIETNYLSTYKTTSLDLLVEISQFNAVIVHPSELIFKYLKRIIISNKNCSFDKICLYFSSQIDNNELVAFELIDTGIFRLLLEKVGNFEGYDQKDLSHLSVLIQKVMQISLIERFYYWLESVFENLSLTERRKSTPKMNFSLQNSNSLSEGSFSFVDLNNAVTFDESSLLTQNCVHLIISSLALNISNDELSNIDTGLLNRFLNCLIKISFNILSEKVNERKLYLSGINLIRGIVKGFVQVSGPSDDSSILQPYDPQIVSIISSILRTSESLGDPLYAACAYGALFNFCSFRQDLQEDLRQKSGRVYNLVIKSIAILKEQTVIWKRENVDNLVVLSIILGVCNMIKVGFDISFLDEDIRSILKSNIEECFIAYKKGELAMNIRASLSGPDRLLLVETWLNLFDESSLNETSVLSILNGMDPQSIESVCLLSSEVFKKINIPVEIDKQVLYGLLNQITQFGLRTRDPLSLDCLIQVKADDKVSFLRQLSNEFLTCIFTDFDTGFGLSAIKAQETLINDFDEGQTVLFEILQKLVSNSLADIEVNYRSEMLKGLRSIFTNPKISFVRCNDLISKWIDLLEEVDSIFLNQLVFFSISSNPQIWDEPELLKLKKHFLKLLASVNTLEMALDSWILLLKSQSKHLGTSNKFDGLVDLFTEQVEDAFQKHRGVSIDSIWERVFGMAQIITNSCDCDMKKVSEFSLKSLEDLNNFK